MKALSSSLLVLAICASAVIPSSAADDKLLLNKRGNVTYQQGTAAAPPVAVALDASVAIANNDYAITGANSQAWITLPDSSVVEVGQNSKVQMAAFDQQPSITTASFIIVGPGKTRFKVAHPTGAKANYTFQTSTGQIAVRGTEGDISTSDTQLQVNVYELGDPNLPVKVALNNGKTFTLGAGQSLVVGVAGGVIASAAVSALSNPLTHPFEEFGPAANVAKVAAAALSGPAAVAAAGAAAVGAVVAGTSHSTPSTARTPTPSPSVSPSQPPGPLVVTPASLTFTAPDQMQTLTAKQRHYAGTFAFSGGSPQVTVTQSGNIFSVTSASAGKTSIIVQGASGTSPVSVPVDVASGKVVLSPSSLAFGEALGQKISFTASEAGYSGNFTISGGSSIVAFNTLTSTGTFMVTSVSNGSSSFTVSDANSHSTTLNVQVLTGPITLSPASLVFLGQIPEPKKAFMATESTFTGTFTATSGDPTSVAVSGPTTTGVFQVIALKSTGAAGVNITVTDGSPWQHTMKENVVVTTPAPSPSTTCVPIIINGKHDHTAASPCPTASASSAPTVPRVRRTEPPPRPHPLGPPPPPGATPKPFNTPRPMLTPPSGPHPGGPSIPGMQTAPPMPGPPGR